MPSIGALTQLGNLELQETDITDSGVAALVELTHLYALDLSSTNVTDELFPCLRRFLRWSTGTSTTRA
jgi:hypothetical protein